MFDVSCHKDRYLSRLEHTSQRGNVATYVGNLESLPLDVVYSKNATQSYHLTKLHALCIHKKPRERKRERNRIQ